jgi:hypothetical protein
MFPVIITWISNSLLCFALNKLRRRNGSWNENPSRVYDGRPHELRTQFPQVWRCNFSVRFNVDSSTFPLANYIKRTRKIWGIRIYKYSDTKLDISTLNCHQNLKTGVGVGWDNDLRERDIVSHREIGFDSFICLVFRLLSIKSRVVIKKWVNANR